uniref:E5 n=1 Tax=Human papillomavirus 45 TaxID=10593 RepID=A9XFL9_HPV45|nr:E5 [human papillomavirus 45]WAB53823.1 E5 ALPHA [human papillomavirus 45]WAB53955.1 E5 ALPHA [human papillomavirus 45]WAB54142.1 E5 ALPHA [human papillomavirus 45]WBM83434.1 E5 ALPHA protein [human papillomavirus 45]
MLSLVFLLCFSVCLYVCCNVPLVQSVYVCAFAWLLVFLFIVVITSPLTAFAVYICCYLLPMFVLHMHALHTIQ